MSDTPKPETHEGDVGDESAEAGRSSKKPDAGRLSLSKQSDYAARPGFRNTANRRSKASKKTKKKRRKR